MGCTTSKAPKAPAKMAAMGSSHRGFRWGSILALEPSRQRVVVLRLGLNHTHRTSLQIRVEFDCLPRTYFGFQFIVVNLRHGSERASGQLTAS